MRADVPLRSAAPHAAPQNVPNAFTAATDIGEPAESAIWSFRKGSDKILEVQWVNTDGCTFVLLFARFHTHRAIADVRLV